MSVEIKGQVVNVLELVSGTSKAGKEWCKQGFIVEQGGQYPKIVCIEVFNKKIEMPELGKTVNVSVNIESREHNGRYYTSCSAWKIETGVAATPPMPDSSTNILNPSDPETDDLPF